MQFAAGRPGGAPSPHNQAGYGGGRPVITPAGLGARFAAYLLEGLLVVVTLGIGWLIWAIVLWGKGTSPAKQMCGLVCVDSTTGELARTGQMASRELVGKLLLGTVTCGVTTVVSIFMVMFGRDRRGVWDSVANTIVVRADGHFVVPSGAAARSVPAPPPPGGPSPAAVVPASFRGTIAVPPPPPAGASSPYSTPSAPLSSPHAPSPSSAAPAASGSATMRRPDADHGVPIAAVPSPPSPPPAAPAASSAPSAPAVPDQSHQNARLSPIIGLRGPLAPTPAVPGPSPTAPPASPAAPGPMSAVPASFGAPAVAAPTPTAGTTVPRPTGGSWQLVFDDGRRVQLSGTVLLGRDPGALMQHPGAQPVPLADPTMELSKTHTAVGLAGDAVWVEDCNSTNGTLLRSDDGTADEIVGRRVLHAGERVVLGGQSFVVERSP